ncbi:hypothetical protein GEMRC1_011830 [Eukaryota sp. GEM-RC1]
MEEQLLSQAKAYLQQTTVSSGLSLYDHLENIIYDSLVSGNNTDLDLLFRKSLIDNQPREKPTLPDAKLSQIVSKSKHVLDTLSKTSIPPLKPSRGLPRTHKSLFSVPSLCTTMSFLQDRFGIGLPPSTTHLLTSGIISFCNTHKITIQNVAFIGSFFTASNPYYAIEIPFAEAPQRLLQHLPTPTPGQIPPEPWGQGANSSVIAVINSSDLDSNPTNWSLLPPVWPEYISSKRSSIPPVFLSGDLTKSLPFYTTEAHYLRSLISLISHATVLAPTGAFEVEEGEEDDDKSVVVAEEFDSEEWSGEGESVLEKWVHLLPHLLPQGRVSFKPPVPQPKPEKIKHSEDSEDEDEEEEEEEIEEPEIKDLLCGVADDVLAKESDKEEEEEESSFKLPLFLKSFISDCWTAPSASFIKSVKYPGSFTVYHEGSWGSVYFGFGDEFKTNFYSPRDVGVFAQDVKMPVELKDPTLMEEQDFVDKKREVDEEAEESEED